MKLPKSIWMILAFVVGMMVSLVLYPKPEYVLVEDNSVETIVSIKQGRRTTILNINRYEDGGGMWVTTLEGSKSTPVTERIEED